jgi:peptidoglycan/xylan/chitin deacetylase (PgdA/CDA1 family)
MSLSNMVDAALGERTLPPRPVIVTVDDGYADFFDIAYPLLCRYRVPACVFVVSAFVEGRDWAWYDKMRYILRESSLPTLQIETGGVSRVFPLRTPADREAAWQHLATEGLSMTIAARNRRIVEMAGAADVDVPAAVPEDFRSSSVDELRGMDPDLVEIGGHTETHPILSHCSDDELERRTCRFRRACRSRGGARGLPGCDHGRRRSLFALQSARASLRDSAALHWSRATRNA